MYLARFLLLWIVHRAGKVARSPAGDPPVNRQLVRGCRMLLQCVGCSGVGFTVGIGTSWFFDEWMLRKFFFIAQPPRTGTWMLDVE